MCSFGSFAPLVAAWSRPGRQVRALKALQRPLLVLGVRPLPGCPTFTRHPVTIMVGGRRRGEKQNKPTKNAIPAVFPSSLQSVRKSAYKRSAHAFATHIFETAVEPEAGVNSLD